jgi:predicted nucleic acid-binding protein
MRFWDSSALVPLLVEEKETRELLDLYREDDSVIAWWASDVECASAIGRLERGGALPPAGATEAFRRLAAFAASWHRIEPTDVVRETAKRLLRTHDLRAGDGLQLAAAIAAAENRPPTLGFVCRDERLALAAEREGFEVW